MIRFTCSLFLALLLCALVLATLARGAAAAGNPYWTAKVSFTDNDSYTSSQSNAALSSSGHGSKTHTGNLLVVFTASEASPGAIRSAKIVSVKGSGHAEVEEHSEFAEPALPSSGESSTSETGTLDLSSVQCAVVIYTSLHRMSFNIEPMAFSVSGNQHSEGNVLNISNSTDTPITSQEDDFPDGGRILGLSGTYTRGKKGDYSIQGGGSVPVATSSVGGSNYHETDQYSYSVDIVPGNEGVKITQVTLPQQNNTAADASNELPLCANSTTKNNDTIHWTVATSEAPGDTLHWSVSPDTGSVSPATGTGNPPDFQIRLPPAGQAYLYDARPAIHVTLKAWLQNSAGNPVGMQDSYKVTQSDLGCLRQEYADHPMTPATSAMKPVPDVSSYVNTATDQPDLAKFNKGDYDWAMVDPWMPAEYGAVGSLPFNSAYRNPVHNWDVYRDEHPGKTPNASSQHMWGNAIDFSTGDTWTGYVKVAKAVVNPTATGVFENTDSHVHVQHYEIGTPSLARLMFLGNTVDAGSSTTGVVILSHSSSTQSTTVTLLCKDVNSVHFPATLTIPAGQLLATFSAQADAGVTSSTSLTITAATMQQHVSASLTVTP